MDNQWSSSLTLASLTLLLLLAACDTPPTPTPQPSAPVAAATSERPETKGLEAASMVGYDGKQIRKSVDKTLNTTDQHNEQLEQDLNNTKQ